MSSFSGKSEEIEDWTSANFNHYLAYVSAGIFFFVALNFFVVRYFVPATSSTNPRQIWKFSNIACSLVHSTITGLGATLIFYADQKFAEDIISSYNESSHMLVSFSIGYFVYDFLDMILYNAAKSGSLLFHHVCVIICFGITARTKLYLPYATVALLIEINSIFLHLRQLCIIDNRKGTPVYRLFALLNVVTFIVFRFFLLGWMIFWLGANKEQLHPLHYLCGTLGLATIFFMNSMLFYRIVNVDFLNKSTQHGSLTDDNFHPISKDQNGELYSFFNGTTSHTYKSKVN